MGAFDRATFGGLFAGRPAPPLVVEEAEELLDRLRERRTRAPEAERAGLDAAIELATELASRSDEDRIAAWVRRQIGTGALGADRVQVTKRIREVFPQMALREAAGLADLALADEPRT